MVILSQFSRRLTKHKTARIFVFVLSTLISSCGTESVYVPLESNHIGNGYIILNANVIKQKDGKLNVELNLQTSNLEDEIQLTGKDTLYVMYAGERFDLDLDNNTDPNSSFYRFDISPYYANESRVNILFERENFEDVNDTYIELPEELEFDSPEMGQQFDKDEIITFSWTPYSGDTNIQINETYQCLQEWLRYDNYSVADNGFFEYLIRDINEPGCIVDFNFTRSVTGHVDSKLYADSVLTGAASQEIFVVIN